MRMTGFKNFIMRGNLVELAVAVVIGTQFSNLVKQFVSSFVNPLLSLVGGTPDFGKMVLKVGTATLFPAFDLLRAGAAGSARSCLPPPPDRDRDEDNAGCGHGERPSTLHHLAPPHLS